MDNLEPNKNLERFETDISEFKGEGIDVQQIEDATAKPHIPNGTIVKLLSGEEVIIEHKYAIYNKVFYDYQGLVKRNNELQKIYFNNEDIEDFTKYLSPEESEKSLCMEQ